MPYFIYALTDPRTDAIAYVGITDNAYKRFKEHINHRGDNRKKDVWVQKLKDEKVMPALKILEVVEDRKIALEREGYWIHHYKEQGATLANIKLKMKKIEPISKAFFVFSPSTPNDLWAEFTISGGLYNEEDIIPYKRLLEWRQVNATVFMSLKENNRVIAYSRLIPLTEEVIDFLLEDKIRERDISLDAIRQWTDPQISVYVSSITAKPSGNRAKDRENGKRIIKYTLDWALLLSHQFNIKNWYGIGTTRYTQRLFERLGFIEMSSPYGGERKGYFLEKMKDLQMETY